MNAPLPSAVFDASQAGGQSPFAALAMPVWRASTVVFDSLDDFVNRKSRLPDGYTYGTSGTPTHRELEQAIAALDQGNHAVLAPSGQAAICLVMLSLLRAGDHLLITDAAYGPARSFALDVLSGLGVNVELYPPRASAAELRTRLRPETRLIWMESPGSITLEVQDVRGIAAMAHEAGVLTGIDNTWASPLGLSPLALGVDLCVHACTKYLSGHSDVLMGSISLRSDALYRRVRATQAQMGQAPSAEDCYLVWRGLQTLPLRWQAQCSSALPLAERLRAHGAVNQVFYPALPDSPDHALWAKQYRGPGSLIAFTLRDASLEAARRFFARLHHFTIGASWGGVHSLAAYYPADEMARRCYCEVRDPVIRLSIGLEPCEQLMDELDHALDGLDA